MINWDTPGKSRLYLWILLLSFILPLATLNAEQIDAQRWKVNVGATETITGPDGVCRKVTNNNCAGPVFVPIKSVAEWQGFLANKPPCVSLGNCCVPVGCGGRCGWVDNGCGTSIDCGSCTECTCVNGVTYYDDWANPGGDCYWGGSFQCHAPGDGQTCSSGGYTYWQSADAYDCHDDGTSQFTSVCRTR